jgi:hypothetical protein
MLDRRESGMSADVPVKVWKMGRGAVPVGTFGEAGWVEL